ncbi:MAG: PAS domain-containing protein [Nitrosomonas sp.]|nr:PAS domain-containing protein [Nitrosomonas sp.]
MSSEDKIEATSTAESAMPSAESPPKSVASTTVIRLGNTKVELGTILNQVGCYIYIKDRMGCYTYVNENVQDLLGTSVDNIIGRDDSDFFDLEASNDLKRNDCRVIESGETIKQEEKVILKATGERRIYQSVKQPIREDHGKIIGLCGISTDITRFRQTENTLNEIIKHLTLATGASGMGTLCGERISILNLVFAGQMELSAASA